MGWSVALPSSVDWKLFDLPVWGPELNWPGTQLYQMSQLEQGPPRWIQFVNVWPLPWESPAGCFRIKTTEQSSGVGLASPARGLAVLPRTSSLAVCEVSPWLSPTSALWAPALRWHPDPRHLIFCPSLSSCEYLWWQLPKRKQVPDS